MAKAASFTYLSLRLLVLRIAFSCATASGVFAGTNLHTEFWNKGTTAASVCVSPGPAIEDELLDCTKLFLDVLPANVVALKAGSVWVVHYSGNVQRRHNLEKLFKQNAMNDINWLDMFDKQKMDSEMCECLFTGKMKAQCGRTGYGPANAWSQYALFYHMVKHNISHVFVMEDDPVFTYGDESQFNFHLTEVMKHANTLTVGWDMIHFGGCLNIHGSHVDSFGFGQSPTGTFGRCTDGYVVSLAGAEKMLAVFQKSAPRRLDDNVDWMFNHIGRKAQPGCKPLQVYLLEPPLFDNGSADHPNNPASVKDFLVGMKRFTSQSVSYTSGVASGQSMLVRKASRQ